MLNLILTMLIIYDVSSLNLGSIKVFNQNVDAETAEEIVTMAYENGQFNFHLVVRNYYMYLIHDFCGYRKFH